MLIKQTKMAAFLTNYTGTQYLDEAIIFLSYL